MNDDEHSWRQLLYSSHGTARRTRTCLSIDYKSIADTILAFAAYIKYFLVLEGIVPLQYINQTGSSFTAFFRELDILNLTTL